MDTVLIIETDTDTITTLSDFLSSHGYLVDAVDDIEAARQKVSGSSPKLVVIGPQLGKSTGFLACSLIKKTPQAKGIPCVLLYTEREEGQVQRHQGLAGRAEVYLRKPFSLDDFRSAVSSYLRLPEQPPGQADDRDVVIEEEAEEYKGAAPQMVEEVVEEVIPAPSAASPELEAERDKLRVEVTKLERELDRSQKDAEKARDEAKKAREEARAAKETPPEALADTETLRGEVGRLEKQLALAQKQAKEAAEGATAAATAAKGKGGSDTRQILELKQTLNKREAELVDSKEASLQKDKQVLELKGKLNDAEMKHVEFEDLVSERDREIASLKGQIEAVTADKDITAKRADDLGRRLRTAEDGLKKAKDEAETQRAANDQAMRAQDEAHALALEQAKRELTAAKDIERQDALDKLRGEMSVEKEAALGAVKAEHEALGRKQQERHDTEIYEMQERFRRSMNQQEEKLTGEKARAIEDLQQKHDAQVAEFVTSHEKEVTALRGEISARDAKIEEANRLAEQYVAEIGKLTEARDELTRERDALDGELKTSQVAAEHLRMEGEAAERRSAALQKDLADAQGVRDQLRAKLEGDLARVDKTKQALTVALDLLNEVEPL